MVDITFTYADALSNWEDRTQHCTVETIEECKRIYGLDNGDVEYSLDNVVYDGECDMNNRMLPLEDRKERCNYCERFNWCKEIHKK